MQPLRLFVINLRLSVKLHKEARGVPCAQGTSRRGGDDDYKKGQKFMAKASIK